MRRFQRSINCFSRHWAMRTLVLAWFCCVGFTGSTFARQTHSSKLSRAWCDNVIVPQSYRNAVPLGRGAKYSAESSRLQLQQVAAHIEIRDQVAQTKLLISIHNPSKTNQTAELLLPIPVGSMVRSFTFNGAATEPSTELLESDTAKHTFESIVAKLKDPALLEFAGYNMIRSSVFPVPPEGDQKVQLVIEQLLPNDNLRIDYTLPRSQSLSSNVPWKITASIKSSAKIATVYSPSHQVAVQRVSDSETSLSVPDQAAAPGAFQLCYLQGSGPLTASLMTSPDIGGKNGHFLLLAGLAQEHAKADIPPQNKIKREVTLILDRSGSMSGEKIEQAKQAAIQVISGLETGESFNIITFNSQVDQFAQRPVVKNAKTLASATEYIQSIKANDGTNIHDALMQGLNQDATEGCLPIVLFLTDGLPTVGKRSESAIREVAEKHNRFNRRIFSFGVGYDVNTPLLDKLATSTRGFATFVTPGENVEVAVSKVFRGLNGPALSDVQLAIVDQRPDQPARIHELMPQQLPDLYEGDQLVVLGSYRGREALKFRVTAKRGSQPVSFDFEFDPSNSRGQPFVSRLWASRKIASLIDQVRDLGANEQALTSAKMVSANRLAALSAKANSEPKIDPRLTELTDSIVAMSKQYGILTEYTSFLATEGVDLADAATVQKLAANVLQDRAVACRSGVGAWSQELNNGQMRSQLSLNLSNRYCNQSGQWVTTSTIQQCRGNALYNRGGRWIEAKLIEKPKIEPDQEVEFGSKEYLKLLWKMVSLGRQDELAVDGEILITVEGKTTLVRGVKLPETEVAVEAAEQNNASKK